jgi:hypothetical protein
MELKDFGKYIRGNSMDKLLHLARKKSLSRILAGERELAMSARRVSALKRFTGNR